MLTLTSALLILALVLPSSPEKYFGREAYKHEGLFDKLSRGLFNLIRGIGGLGASFVDKDAKDLATFLDTKVDKDSGDINLEFDDFKIDSVEFKYIIGLGAPIAIMIILWFVALIWFLFWLCAQCCQCCCCPEQKPCCCCCCCFDEEEGPSCCCYLCTKICWVIIFLVLFLAFLIASVQSFFIPSIIDEFSSSVDKGYSVTGKITDSADSIDYFKNSLISMIGNLLQLVETYLPLGDLDKDYSSVKAQTGPIQTSAENMQQSITDFSTAINPDFKRNITTVNEPFMGSSPFHLIFTKGTSLTCSPVVPFSLYTDNVKQFLDQREKQNPDAFNRANDNIQTNLQKINKQIQDLKRSASSIISAWDQQTQAFFENVAFVRDVDTKKIFEDVQTMIDSDEIDFSENTFFTDLKDSSYKAFDGVYRFTELAYMKLLCCGYYESASKLVQDQTVCAKLEEHVESQFCDETNVPDGIPKDDWKLYCTAARNGIDGESPLFDYTNDKIAVVEYLGTIEEALNTGRDLIKDFADEAINNLKELIDHVNDFDMTDIQEQYKKTTDSINDALKSVEDIDINKNTLLDPVADINATLKEFADTFEFKTENTPAEITGKSKVDMKDIDLSTIRSALKTGSVGLGLFFIICLLLLISQCICGIFFDWTFCFGCCTVWHFIFLIDFCFSFIVLGALIYVLLEFSEFYYSDEFIDYIKYNETDPSKSGVVVRMIDKEMPKVELNDLKFNVMEETLDFSDIIQLNTKVYADALSLLLDFSADDAANPDKNPLLGVLTRARDSIVKELKKFVDFNKFFGNEDDRVFTLKPYALATAWYSLDQKGVVVGTEESATNLQGKSVTEFVKDTVLKDKYLEDIEFEEIDEDKTTIANIDSILDNLKSISSSDLFPFFLSVFDPLTLTLPSTLAFFFVSTFLFFTFFPCLICCNGCARSYWPPYPADSEAPDGETGCCMRHCFPLKWCRKKKRQSVIKIEIGPGYGDNTDKNVHMHPMNTYSAGGEIYYATDGAQAQTSTSSTSVDVEGDNTSLFHQRSAYATMAISTKDEPEDDEEDDSFES